EPSETRYTADAIIRYSPASQANFAGYDTDGNEVELASSENSFYLRPLTDPEVAMTGTGSWPTWKQNEYMTWGGWNAAATTYHHLNGTNIAPEDLRDVWMQHYLRKDLSVDTPNYEVDATVGGPVPGLHQLLGDLRFLASYRQTQNA